MSENKDQGPGGRGQGGTRPPTPTPATAEPETTAAVRSTTPPAGAETTNAGTTGATKGALPTWTPLPPPDGGRPSWRPYRWDRDAPREMPRRAREVANARAEMVRIQAEMDRQRETLLRHGLTPGQVDSLQSRSRDRLEQVRQQHAAAKAAMRGELSAEVPLDGLGRRLVELRMAAGLSQGQLARRLGVSDQQVSRDERRFYAGVGLAKAERVLSALGQQAVVTLAPVRDG